MHRLNRKLDSSAPSANRKHCVDTAGVDVGLAPILPFELNGRRGKPNLTKPDGFEIAAIVLRYLGITFDKPLIVDKLANPPPNLQKMSDR
jgi:hypothetical protein